MRIYHHYTLWEDYHNGLYRTTWDNEDLLIAKAIELLSNPDLFYSVALEMIDQWPISAEVNLTNKESNRKSWIGQASCCYYANTPEILTCMAWGKLTQNQRDISNAVANKIINHYEIKDEQIKIEF